MAGQRPGGMVGAITPARGAAVVNLSDTVDLTNGICRALYVGVAGAVKVSTADGDAVVFKAVNAGSVLPIQVKRVWATGTDTSTAADILALY